MRRVTACLLAAVLAVSLIGCGLASNETKKNGNRRTEEAGKNSSIKPGGKETEKSTDPSGSGDSGSGREIPVTWTNWKSYVEFYEVSDNTRADPSVKAVDYTFAVRAKEGYELVKLSLLMNVTIYYRAGKADMKEYVEKDVVLTETDLTHNIRFSDDEMINYNGRTVESVYYGDILSITGKVVKK